MEKLLSIDALQQEIAEEFSFFDNWEDKYGYIIDLGKSLPELDSSHKTESNKIKGCQSQVWLNSYLDNGKIFFEADSDASIVKGLISLLVRIYSGRTPDEILNTELTVLENIGMSQHLSPTRSNGLSAMVKQMKMRALAYKAKTSQTID